MKKRLGFLLLLIASLPLIGYLYERWAANEARKRLTPPGRLIKVGAAQFHLNEQGQQHSGLTVVLESGAGGFSPEWRDIQAEVAKFARVVSYDRAGHGWSDTGDIPRTPGIIVKELHSLLKAANLPEPYILVGHSSGGIYAMAFADRYGAETAGVVLVDASHPEMHLRPELNIRDEKRDMFLGYLGAVTGYQRLKAGIPEGHFASLPTDLLRAYIELRPRSTATMYHEIVSLWDKPLSFDLGDTPMTVITRTPAEHAFSKAWQELQADLLNFSASSKQVIAEKAGHEVHLDEPQPVIDAIRKMVELEQPQNLNGARR